MNSQAIATEINDRVALALGQAQLDAISTQVLLARAQEQSAACQVELSQALARIAELERAAEEVEPETVFEAALPDGPDA
jgi:hypothetical protein